MYRGIKTICLLLVGYAVSCHSFVSNSLGKGRSTSKTATDSSSYCRSGPPFYPKKSLQPMLHLQKGQTMDLHDFDRRSFISFLITSTASAALAPLSCNAVELQTALLDEPPITHTVAFNVRISRADGTLYTKKDDASPTPDNQVFTGTVSIGLYGTLCPNHVKRFLDYVDVMYSPGDDTPLPSYARSQFSSLDQSTGILTGGLIPGLRLTNFAGSSALEYGGRILPSKLWIDDFKDQKKVSHAHAGLLTHRDLDVLPKFGITTRSCPELNLGHTVFGTVLPTESSKAFLSRCVDLPTYSLDRPTVPIGDQSRASEEVASSIYSLQKDLFRSAAKTFGDTRLDNVYEGKLLRRVEVTSVSSKKL
jgi:cyclophilin family peptidyl-prolyl cis-trans isomerase